jgi:ribonuclease HII
VARGPLFGRTYAAAVTLPPLAALPPAARRALALVRDSKAVPRKQMAALAAEVRLCARAFAVVHVEPVDIDGSDIRQAVLRAMREAVATVRAQLPRDETCFVLADGRDLPSPVVCNGDDGDDDRLPVVCEVKADARYASVACAAILAKAEHDAHVHELCAAHPALVERYALDRNMGYGSRAHLAGLELHGPTYWHRQSFAPVRRAVIACAARAVPDPVADPLGVPPLRVDPDNRERSWRSSTGGGGGGGGGGGCRIRTNEEDDDGAVP